MRISKSITFPHSKSAESKVRIDCKVHNGLGKNVSMESIYRNLGIFNKAHAYAAMVDLYNQRIQTENVKIIQDRKVLRNEKAKAKRQTIKRDKQVETHETFVIHMEVEVKYLKSYYETAEKIRYPIGHTCIIQETTNPIYDLRKNIPEIVFGFNSDDGYKICTVLSYNVVFMNTTALVKSTKRKIKQRMRRSFVLANHWLKHSHGIAQTAYDDADNKCVYHQLIEYLSNPPSNLPSPFIYYKVGPRKPLSEESLYRFFCEKIEQNNLSMDYENFTIDSGVSSELIALLCESLKRNMYAYDEDDKIFHSVTSSNSKNYCPIVFYKMNGHCYLINNKSVISSTAETNKNVATKIISITIEEKKNETKDYEVFHLENYDVYDSPNMEEGIYLVNQSNLNSEVIKFMEIFRENPKTKSKKSSIIQIKFQVGLKHIDEMKDRKYVIICIDATHGQNFDHCQLKRVTEANGIKYVNENIGSVILSILDKSMKSERKTFTEKERMEFINLHKNRCKNCRMYSAEWEIDHIIPLAAGGTNDNKNLQLLCVDCHKDKTIQEKLDGTYKIKDIESSVFNTAVITNVIDNKSWNAYQFVEKLPFACNGKISGDLKPYKIDTKKCRRNILLHSKYEFPVYSVMDIPKPFSKGDIQCGMYYVETGQVFPFRGAGWYSHPLVEYGLQKWILKVEEIKMEFIPSYTLPANHFHKHIDTLLDAFKDEGMLQKQSVNAMVGLFGKTKRSSSLIKYTLEIEEASLWWGEANPKVNVFIENIKLDNGLTIYKGVFSEDVEVEGMKYPIYKQILEMEALELHTLESIIIRNKGIILDRNTDAIRYARNEPINITSFHWDDIKMKIPNH